jgi:hypothetical protein
MAVPDLLLEPHAWCVEGEETRLRVRPVNQGYTSPSFSVALTRAGEPEPFQTKSIEEGLGQATRGAVLEFVIPNQDAELPLLVTIDAGESIDECDEGNNEMTVE